MTPTITALTPDMKIGERGSAYPGSETALHPGQAVPRTTITRKKRALFLLGEEFWDLIYPSWIREKIESMVDIVAPPQSKATILAHPELLENVEIIFSGWGTAPFDAGLLRRAPRLEAVFYGSGSIKPFVGDEFWNRGIVITSALSSNAIPVAEYTVGAILLSMKHFWKNVAQAKRTEGWGQPSRYMPGCYHSKVGLVSFGATAQKVLEFLKNFEMDIHVHCPFLTEDEARELGVTPVSLEEIFRICDVVSLHTPVLPETIGMIDGKLIASMKKDATLINTARGVIINESEMIDVLRRRQDIIVVTDVTDPNEPPLADSPLLTLPNIVVTPHIAGSQGPECARMGAYMLEELQRYLTGKPLRWQVTRDMLERMG